VEHVVMYLQNMDAFFLAQELARRMREVVPSGIKVTTEKDMLWFESDSYSGKAGSYACQWLYKGDGEPERLLTDACWHALDDLQDFVDEATTEPWPGERTPPKAHARLENGSVILWFGDAETPDLVLESLPIVA
jgi:hypothetical protein